MTAVTLLVVLAVLVQPPRHQLLVRWPGRGRRPVRERRAAVQDDCAASAELFAAALASGLDPVEATRWVAPQARPGPDGVSDWWRALSPAVGRALDVSQRLGSPAADLVRAAAASERERQSLDRDLASGLAGVTATAWLLTALPVAGIVLVPLVVGESATDPVSRAAVGLGLCLTAGGWWGLRHLVRRTRERCVR